MKSNMEIAPPRLIGSRPTRGAWIEICMRLVAECRGLVAPHTGRVD